MSDVPAVNLTNCDREPIHVPGSIQPHGCLLACDVVAMRVLRHSANAPEMLGLSGDINGNSLEAVLGEQIAHDLRNALSRTADGARAALVFGEQTPSGRRFDIAVHQFKCTAIIELEPAQGQIARPLELTRMMMGRIAAIETPEKLTRDTAKLIRSTLGYDRVMIYRFGHDGAGKVINEAKRHDLESFLGQYFPATDIPQQARALYLKNTIRIISDARCVTVPVVPVLDASGEPLDLSHAHLRSVSPIHCEYLRNMGVAASMSISIIVDGVLWGLIACHHYSPKTMSMAERAAAEMFGEFFSLHLTALRHKQTYEIAFAARAGLDSLLREAARGDDINASIRQNLDGFGRLIPSDGVASWLDGTWTADGSAPPAALVPVLVRLAETVAEGKIWSTHQLSNTLPQLHDMAADVSGVLIVPLSQRPRDYLFFFRREVVQTLDWAGNPDKVYETGPLGDRLTPRKSFAIWKETVRHQSEPWTDAERQFAESMRAALVEVVLRHSELLADERSKSEVRQRMMNEELNHRVKNILAVIKSLVTQPSAAGQSLEVYVQSLQGRIQALSVAHDQVMRGDGGGSLARLISAELTPYRADQTMISGPSVWLDARAYSILALVLHEMATNAAKYGALSSTKGRLSVTWQVDFAGNCELVWTETGGPPVTPPTRKGFGSVLIDRSIPFDLGGKSNVDYLKEGVRAEIRIPERFVTVRHEEAAAVVLQDVGKAADATFAGKRVLIVEDQLLIAMDLERILEDWGAEILATSTSPSEALAVLRRERPDVAVLDVNLGDTTSEPVAAALSSAGVPFIFATGYGDGSAIPEGYESVPVVRKPYDAQSIRSELTRLV